MFKKLLLALFFIGFATAASAQTCPTRPLGDATNACADTKFVANAIAAIPPTGGTVTSVACGGVVITASGTCPTPFAPLNCSLAASQNGTVLTVSLKDASGADPSATSPCYLAFRSTTATSGATTYLAITSALSVNTNAAGATLATTSNTAFRFYAVVFNNSGTPVLALYNATTSTTCLGIDTTLVQSSTPFSGTATAGQTYYTPSGTTVTSKAISPIGYIEYNSTGLATAGTYATSPNFIQTFAPDVRKPCEVFDGIQLTVTNSFTTRTGSTAAITTTLSQAITLASAADRVQVTLSGTLECVTTTGAASAKLWVMRAGTTISPPVFIYCSAAGVINIGPVGLIYTDAPNTTSSVTYSGAIAPSVAAETALFPAPGPDSSGGGVITLSKVRG